MSTSQGAFEKRERAAEEVFFRQEERLHMLKHLEHMVSQGKLKESVLDEVKKATSPDVHHATGVEVSRGVFKDVPGELKHRGEYVYAHTPGGPAPPRETEADRMKAVPHTDMGPGRWAPGGDSVFALGSLAEPAANQALPAHEAARLARISSKAGDVPTVFGYRLASSTPGRTFFWGSVLAIWGTAALVAASARGMGPRSGATEPAREGGGYSPLGERVAAFFMPWRERVTTRRATRAELEEEEGIFVRKLKESMVTGKA